VPDDDNPFTVNPHDLSREDEAVRDDTFRAWLWRAAADINNPYYRLRTVIGPSGAPFGGKYDEEKYAAHLERLAPEEPELVEALIEAAAAWALEQRARGISRKELGIVDTEKARTKMVPATVCGFVNVTGSRCRKMAVPGSIRCPEHGGALMSPEVRRAMLISAYCSIVTHTQLAVDALAEVASKGRNELARVQAAKELLDRAGLSPEIQIKVEIEGDTRSEAIERLRERLDGMQRGLAARVLDTSAQDADPTEDFPVSDSNGHANGGNGHDPGGHP
jgi:hypothetical protein